MSGKAGLLRRMFCRLFHGRHHRVVTGRGGRTYRCRCERCGVEFDAEIGAGV